MKNELGRELMAYFLKQYFEEKKKPKIKEKDLKEIRVKVLNAIYESFCEIRSVLENDGLDDFQCVEQIIKVYENIGLHCGDRHDFG